MTVTFHDQILCAPLAGVTDRVFRGICRSFGADLVVTEMVSADGLTFNPGPSAEIARIEENERPAGIQLFGADPARCAEAVRLIDERFEPDFIDLNAGCPVRKVVSGNGGAALLKDPDRFRRIVSAMVAATARPVTVKLRSGWTRSELVDTLFARIARDAGAAAVTLHPRTRNMGFGGQAMWDRIRETVVAVSIPVIGNGDITCGDDAVRMKRETGCAGVMIGRAVYGNPFVFSEVRAALQGGKYQAPSPEQRLAVARDHALRFREVFGEFRAVKEMKKQCAWYVKGFPRASRLRDELFRAESFRELLDVLSRAAPSAE